MLPTWNETLHKEAGIIHPTLGQLIHHPPWWCSHRYECSQQCRSILSTRGAQRFQASLLRCVQSLAPHVRSARKNDSRATAHYAVRQHVGRAIKRCSQTSLTDFFIVGLAEGTLWISLQLALSVVQSNMFDHHRYDWLAP